MAVRSTGRETRLADLRQEGCLKACFPRDAGSAFQATLLNSSGGITDGDILDTKLSAAPGASLTATTQAAERIYRARDGVQPARLRLHIAVARHARVEYLPQETIIFNHAALDRKLQVQVDEDATYLGCETLIFGRARSGEVLDRIDLRDTVEIHRANGLVLRECILMRGPAARTLQGPATNANAIAVSSILYAAPDAEARLQPLRNALAAEAPHAGASFRDGILMARIVTPDAAHARRALTAGLAVLRDNAPLPRVWQT